MTEKIEIEYFLAIDEEGNTEIDTDATDAAARLAENWGGSVCRIIKLKMKVAPPVIEEAEIDIPDHAGTTESIEVEAA